MSGIKIGYIRVSTIDQNTDRQLDGLKLDRTYIDKASGKSADRPKLAELIDFAREGDTIVIHSMDRLARNLDDLRRIVQNFTKKGIRVEFIKEQLLFSGDDAPMANLMLSMMGAFAEFERSMILERQREGIAIAKAAGVYKGRKKALSATQAAELRQRAAAGEHKTVLAKDFGISRDAIYDYLKAI